jgi:hypothetical protein
MTNFYQYEIAGQYPKNAQTQLQNVILYAQ